MVCRGLENVLLAAVNRIMEYETLSEWDDEYCKLRARRLCKKILLEQKCFKLEFKV